MLNQSTQQTTVDAVIKKLNMARDKMEFQHIPTILTDAKKAGVKISDEDIRCALYDVMVDKIRSEARAAALHPGGSSTLFIVTTEFKKALEANDLEIVDAILSAAELEFKIGEDTLQTLRNTPELLACKNRILRHDLLREFSEAIHQNNLVLITSTLEKAIQYANVMQVEPSLSAYYAMINMMCVRSEAVMSNESSNTKHFENILKNLNAVRMTLETKCRSHIMGQYGSLYPNTQTPVTVLHLQQSFVP